MGKPCTLCHGTGQRCYFKGESRFLLSWEDCPACGGTGCCDETTAAERRHGGTPADGDTDSRKEPLADTDTDSPS